MISVRTIDLERMNFDTIITEVSLQNSTGLDLIEWLNQHYPHIHPVVICHEEDQDLVEVIRTRRAGYLIRNKPNLLQFRNKLQAMCKYKRGMIYQFSQISLFELVKLVSFSGSDYHLYLTSPQTHQEGLIYFSQGNVKHAMYGELTGENVFYEVMKMKRGLFSEMLVIENEEAGIESSLDQLMTNSALILDQKDGFSPQIKLPPTHCLIISEDMHIQIFLGELFHFQRDSVLVTSSVSTMEGMHEELMKNPELAILDLDMKSIRAKKVIEFIDEQYLDTRIILMKTQLQPGLNQILKHPHVVRFFNKSSQYQELAELIEQTYLSQQFSGELLDMSLFGVLQILSYFCYPRLLEVTDFFSGQAGQIFINQGEIRHSTYGDDTGRDALKKILKINYGVFRQEAYWKPVTRSLNIPFNRLMMYLSRFVHEEVPHQSIQDLLLQSGDIISVRAQNITQQISPKS